MTTLHRAGEIPQRSGESVAYSLDTTNVGDTPTVVSVNLFNRRDFDTNINITNLTGTSLVLGNIISGPLVHSLADRDSYRLIFTYQVDGNTFADYITILCEDDEN